ncbi:MAG TPA: peptidoglycan-binding protein [Moorella mulderi]|nr:peptidoglycan-binding protein [Moorella mulderi]
MEGLEVLELQMRLARLGYFFGPYSGLYDPCTQKAVENLQQDQGLPVSGKADKITWEHLIKSCLQKRPPSPPFPFPKK